MRNLPLYQCAVVRAVPSCSGVLLLKSLSVCCRSIKLVNAMTCCNMHGSTLVILQGSRFPSWPGLPQSFRRQVSCFALAVAGLRVHVHVYFHAVHMVWHVNGPVYSADGSTLCSHSVDPAPWQEISGPNEIVSPLTNKEACSPHC